MFMAAALIRLLAQSFAARTPAHSRKIVVWDRGARLFREPCALFVIREIHSLHAWRSEKAGPYKITDLLIKPVIEQKKYKKTRMGT